MRNSRQFIDFPSQLDNLWYPHSSWFDLRRISNLNVLCLDPCDVYINIFDNEICMMDEIKINKHLHIDHLFINVASVTSMQMNVELQIPLLDHNNNNNNNQNQQDIERQNFVNNLVSLSNLLSRADNITFCTIKSESIKNALQSVVPVNKLKCLHFVNDINIFHKQVHQEMELINVFDNEYEYIIHNKTIQDQHAQICHLDIIDDILGSINIL